MTFKHVLGGLEVGSFMKTAYSSFSKANRDPFCNGEQYKSHTQ